MLRMTALSGWKGSKAKAGPSTHRPQAEMRLGALSHSDDRVLGERSPYGPVVVKVAVAIGLAASPVAIAIALMVSAPVNLIGP